MHTVRSKGSVPRRTSPSSPRYMDLRMSPQGKVPKNPMERTSGGISRPEIRVFDTGPMVCLKTHRVIKRPHTGRTTEDEGT